jgi:hypothetical protein
MLRSTESWDEVDDLARQRRKRETRLLDQRLMDFPDLTLADVVADVLAASDSTPASFDVPGYLLTAGYRSQTIEAVVGYLHRHYTPDLRPARLPRL